MHRHSGKIWSKENSTAVTEFVLLGFTESPGLHILFFALLLSLYIITLLANILIILIVKADPMLNTPMYFFLVHLSFLEVCYTTVTIPNMLENLLSGPKAISIVGCAMQMFFFLFFGDAECFLLAAMAFDRYVAICHPLRYTIIMRKSVSAKLVGITYLCGAAIGLVHTTSTFHLPFCGVVINHFFCEIQPLLELVCGDTFLNEVRIIGVAMLASMMPFLLIVLSYIRILYTILAMPSSESRQKAFSTCSSHLVVVTLFFGAGSSIYLKPKSSYNPSVDKFLSLSYTVVTPLLNPIIYSLRNKEMKNGLRKLWKKTLPM
ncbi:olfactory receptor 10C1-like [Rhineura floridana]|uniref:olfactory receptor 10C1-like n=1 Tax=Rhineura floridana TaxID=261503 RepID=UPI002AC87362|nr:olfactory receptor 10C1-like [Rhineura floridana]